MTSSGERQMLRETVAALIDKHASPAAVREAMESERGYDESLWSKLCEQVGVAALVVPEELGGASGELADAAAVLEELGRGLVPTPLLGTTLAELALLATDEPDTDALEALAAGEAIGAVVFDPGYVVNGDIADVVVAIEDGKLTRWSDVTAETLKTMDPTRRLARVSAGSSTTIGSDPALADTAAILLAAEQIGAAARCLELTVEYTKERVQFGRPIGSFQALKHRMADLYVAVQSARAVVGDAIATPTPVSAALARLAATEAFTKVAGEAIQMHGGIAITWEHDIQLYFKRAHGSAQLLGSVSEQLRQLESEVF
jgi:alkylation response protein AidB-like acyl-CoA dehydrogenase